MSAYTDTPIEDLLEIGKAAVRREKWAILRTKVGRATAIEMAESFQRPKRETHLTVKEAIRVSASLYAPGEVSEDILEEALFKKLTRKNWTILRSAVWDSSERSDPEWHAASTALGLIVGEITARNRGMIYHFAKVGSDTLGCEIDEYANELILLLPYALELFRPNEGTTFWSYFQFHHKALMSDLHHSQKLIKQSSRSQVLSKRIQEYRLECLQATGTQPDLEQIAAHLGVSPSFVEASEITYVHLDRPYAASHNDGNVHAQEKGSSSLVGERYDLDVDHQEAYDYDSALVFSKLNEVIETLEDDPKECYRISVNVGLEHGLKSLPIPLSEARKRLLTHAAKTLAEFAGDQIED